MQSINITVINPLFMIVLFGTALLSLVLSYFAVRQDMSLYIILGAVLYLTAIIVTMIFNVPLNEALASIDPAASGATDFWRNYLQNWTFWNHIRGIASLAACSAFIWA
jgi:uncharacterized membrane protein